LGVFYLLLEQTVKHRVDKVIVLNHLHLMKKELSFKTKNYSIIPSQSLSIGARNQIPDFTLSGDSQNKNISFSGIFSGHRLSFRNKCE